MKTLFLPLLAATSIVSVLAPHAEAGAIALDPGALRPHFLGPVAYKRSFGGAVPTGAIKLRLVPTVFAISSSDAGAIKTGAGTLTLSGSTGNFGGSILTVGSSIDFGVSQTFAALNISDGAVVFLNPPTAALVGQWSSSDPAAALAWASGTDAPGTDQRDLALQNYSGTIQIGVRELAPNGGTISVVAPVPEPASAILLVIGALAASRSRRRRES